jgi:hypothetical protein
MSMLHELAITLSRGQPSVAEGAWFEFSQVNGSHKVEGRREERSQGHLLSDVSLQALYGQRTLERHTKWRCNTESMSGSPIKK